MKAKTRDLLKKITVAVSVIGAIGTLVAIGDTMFGGSNGGGPAGGQIITPNPGPQGGGGSGGSGTGGGTGGSGDLGGGSGNIGGDSGDSGSGGSGSDMPVKPIPNLDTQIPLNCSEVYPTFFSGGIDTVGKLDNTDRNAYTAFPLETSNLTIGLENDHELMYTVYFYDVNDNFVSKSSTYANGAKIDAPINTYARIEVQHKRISILYSPQKNISKLHVFLEKNKVVDIQGRKGINDGKPYVREGGNYYNVLNGVYRGTNYTCTVRNGLFIVEGKGDGVNGELIPLNFCLDTNLVGNYSFQADSAPDNLGTMIRTYYFQTDVPVVSGSDQRYTPFKNDWTIDTTKISSANPNLKIVGGMLKLTQNDDYTVPYKFYPMLTKKVA